MPLIRSPSTGNTLNIADEVEEENIEQQNMIRKDNNIGSHMVTRRQAQLAAMNGNGLEGCQINQGNSGINEEHVRSIIHDSLNEFRLEISRTIGEEIRGAIANSNVASTNRNGEDQRRGNPLRRIDLDANESSVRPTSLSKDKLSNLIYNWHVTFKGPMNEVSIEDFIYRINTLTNIHLAGDFDIICQHAHILFEGKAEKWYWRYHRQTGNSFTWGDLCRNLRRQFKDTTSEYDLKEDMRRRKQRQNESFEDFLEILMGMSDRLETPLTEKEFIEMLIHNLKTELRYELLHVNIPNISVLRSEVRKHEKFYDDLKQWPQRSNFINRRQIAEIGADEECEDEVDVLNSMGEKLRCWNCDATGHRYHDCLAPRRIFCYGCGALDTYKPDCAKCGSKKGSLNSKRDVRLTMGPHPH